MAPVVWKDMLINWVSPSVAPYSALVIIPEKANFLDETSALHDSEKNSGVKYNSDIQYGEWSQEQMEQFMADFEESRKKKRKKKVA